MPGWLVALVLVALVLAGAWWRAREQRKEAEQQAADRLVAQTQGFIEAIEQRRAFAPVAVPMNLTPGEFAVKADPARLYEMRRSRVGGGLGTRVKVGGFPVYVGGYRSAPVESMVEHGRGDLVVTNRRLLFVSGARTLAVPFDHLLICTAEGALLMVGTDRAKAPYAFALPNPALWQFLVNWLAKLRPAAPELPAGMHLRVKRDARTATEQPMTIEVDDGRP